MTVAELIARLKNTDPNRTVQIARYDDGVLYSGEVLAISDNQDSKAHDIVWLEAR
ncbi:hypothetical protein [Streptomyces sp. ITFR-6]|uniref:hypothetical protein n=1 Tax=Streptomyces sp. ITFR-6 TaxID=3075197 RepID=UPI00288BF851|nr:hypothetical protein [Streptomyces sp. ITFR-6]WNI28622.1 hypothetical protein RLT59_07350 [Streptomyces sp. ITFR-6]